MISRRCIRKILMGQLSLSLLIEKVTRFPLSLTVLVPSRVISLGVVPFSAVLGRGFRVGSFLCIRFLLLLLYDVFLLLLLVFLPDRGKVPVEADFTTVGLVVVCFLVELVFVLIFLLILADFLLFVGLFLFFWSKLSFLALLFSSFFGENPPCRLISCVPCRITLYLIRS